MLSAILILLAMAVLYWFAVRRWFACWGTTREERTRVMAGDAILANPTDTTTHAVTVDAPPDDIWPWLAQMGYQRGGLYSYDWLDHVFGFLDRPSADRILPEFQHLAVGDRILLGPREELTVAAVEPPRALVLSYNAHAFEWVWQFGLYPIDGERTRLVTRGTERVPRTAGGWLMMRVMEPAAFVMTRKMLLNLKERAEALHRASRSSDAGHGRRAMPSHTVA
jgi:hypothetical protein